MTRTTTMSEPRWTPKDAERPAGEGYWEIDMIVELSPGWWGKLFGQRHELQRATFAYLTAYRDHASCLGWIDATTRHELSMHTFEAEMLEAQLEKHLREEQFAGIHQAVIKRVAP